KIRRLCALGYRYGGGRAIERDQLTLVMTDWLRAFLHSRYAQLPVEAAGEVVARFTPLKGGTTQQQNLHFHQLLTGGYVAMLYDEKILCSDAEAVKKNLKVDWTRRRRPEVNAGVEAAVKKLL